MDMSHFFWSKQKEWDAHCWWKWPLQPYGRIWRAKSIRTAVQTESLSAFPSWRLRLFSQLKIKGILIGKTPSVVQNHSSRNMTILRTFLLETSENVRQSHARNKKSIGAWDISLYERERQGVEREKEHDLWCLDLKLNIYSDIHSWETLGKSVNHSKTWLTQLYNQSINIHK